VTTTGNRKEGAEVEVRPMEREDSWECSLEATGKSASTKGARHMDAAARDGNLTAMLVRIRTSLLASANGIHGDASAVRELEAFFWGYIRLVQAYPGMFRLLRSSEMRRRPSRLQIRIEYEGFLEWIRQSIATGIRNGSIRGDLDPRPLALLLMGMLEALTTRWLLNDCTSSLEESAVPMWQTFRTLVQRENTMPDPCNRNGPERLRAARQDQACGPADSTRPIRLMLVDDHPGVRQAVAQALRSEAGLEVVGEAESGAEALALTRRIGPDVILMDINLPDMDGIEATRQLRVAFPKTAVIGYSMYEGVEAAIRQAGAGAYVSKSAPFETLLAAIRATRAQNPA
jgi:CheY-like chemotaxis protein